LYRIDITEYGVKISQSGIIKIEEAVEWAEKMLEILKNMKPGFKLFADMRGIIPAGRDVQDIYSHIQQEFRANGLDKSVIVLDNALSVLQMKKTAKTSGVAKYERYLNSDKNDEWESQAIAWILEGTEP